MFSHSIVTVLVFSSGLTFTVPDIQVLLREEGESAIFRDGVYFTSGNALAERFGDSRRVLHFVSSL